MEPSPQDLNEDAHLVEFNTFGIRNAPTINNETIVNSNESNPKLFFEDFIDECENKQF